MIKSEYQETLFGCYGNVQQKRKRSGSSAQHSHYPYSATSKCSNYLSFILSNITRTKHSEMGFAVFCSRNTREHFVDLHFYCWSSSFLCGLVYVKIPI